MFWKKKKGKMASTVTSIEAYSNMGLLLTDEQFTELSCINLMMRSGCLEDIPVHGVVLTLKTLGLIPAKQVDEVCNDESANNTKNK